MSPKYSSLTFELLEDFLQQLSAPTQLDHHALVGLLWDTPLVKNHLALHPQDQTLPRGRIIGLALRALLHIAQKPPRLSDKLRIRWNKFLFLEIKFFYPFAHLTRFPENNPETGALLCDEKYLALVIADGDQTTAERLARENKSFFEAFIPDESIPSSSTLSARQKSSARDFWEELIKRLELWDSLLSPDINTPGVSDTPNEPSTSKPSRPVPTDGSAEHEGIQPQETESNNEPPSTEPAIESTQPDIPSTSDLSSLAPAPTDVSVENGGAQPQAVNRNNESLSTDPVTESTPPISPPSAEPSSPTMTNDLSDASTSSQEDSSNTASITDESSSAQPNEEAEARANAS